MTGRRVGDGLTNKRGETIKDSVFAKLSTDPEKWRRGLCILTT